MNNKGFSIIELLVYTGVATFIVMLTMQWITVVLAHNKESYDRSVIGSTLCCAHSLIFRDVLQAPRGMHAWKLLQPTKFIVDLDYTMIGWELVDTHLLRSEGQYNTNEQRWMKRTQSLVAEHVTRFVVQPQYGDSENMRSVNCTIEISKNARVQDMHFLIMLRNGVCI